MIKWIILGVILFQRCVHQERISIRGSVRPSDGPSVSPTVRRLVDRSVGPLRLCKNRVSWLFLATVRSDTETNDQRERERERERDTKLRYGANFDLSLKVAILHYERRERI